MYTAPIPNLKEVKVHKRASLKKFSIKQALRLKMTPADKHILRELKKEISQKKK